MQHPHTIFVTNLFDMPYYVTELAPVRLVSIIQPEFQPPRPPELDEAVHLRVGVHDISERQLGGILIGQRDVEELVEFISRWDPHEGALLVHCYAGISRSTATALIAAFIKTGDAAWSARALRAAAPHAKPNRRIIALADEVLDQQGALIEAREAMGEAELSLAEGPLASLSLR